MTDQEQTDWVRTNFLNFEKNLNGGSKLPLHVKRKEALSAFEKSGFPTTEIEDWKYTNPKAIQDGSFSLITKSTPSLTLKQIEPHLTKDIETYLLVFVDGRFEKDLSASIFEKGLLISSIQDCQNSDSNLYTIVNEKLGTLAKVTEPFVAINTSFINDGIVVHLAKKAVISKPIEVIFLTTNNASKAAIQPRILFLADESSTATIIEKYASLDAKRYLTNSVIEFFIDENCDVKHYRVQNESIDSYHVSTIQAALKSNSKFSTMTFSFGSTLARNNVNVVMNGSNCFTTMNGLSALTGNQHVDNTTLLDHADPHCESLELYKGIYDGKSEGVFSGTIIVREDAQKTNAIQSNRSILLTEEASVNTRPQLKIWADDVKCTHGATIGQLDDEALFYIRSRGIEEREARLMLVRAFASQIINCVEIEALKEELEKLLVEKLSL